MRHLKLPIGSADPTLRDVVRMLGTSEERARRFVQAGLLQARRSDRPRSRVQVRREDIERFLREHPHAIEWYRIRDPRLRAIAQLAAAEDPLLGSREVVRYLGIPRTVLDRLITEGTLPARRANGTHWRFRRSDVLALATAGEVA